MRSLEALTSCALVFALAGCGAAPPDYQAMLDRDVETTWKVKWNPVDAIRFFESGGSFVDSGDPDDPALDRPHVLPLLLRLKDKFGLDWQAFVYKDDAKTAVAVAARIPADPDVRPKIEAALDEEQRTFPGEIHQTWGHEWLSLDFLNEEEAEFFEDDDEQ